MNLSKAFSLAKSPLAIYLAASVLARVGGIVLIPLYTRRLSAEAYGDYALAQTLVNILPSLFTAGLVVAIPRFFYEGDEMTSKARTATLSSWLVVLAVAGGVISEAFVLVFGHTGPGLSGRWELSCIVVAGVGSALSSIPAVYLRAAQRPLAASAFQIAQFLLQAGAGIVFVAVYGRGLRGSIEAAAAGYVVMGLASAVFIRRHLSGKLDIGTLASGLKFSITFLPHLLAGWVQGVTDRWTLKTVGLEGDLGKYSLASTLASPVQMVVAAFADADNPKQGETFRRDGLLGLARALRRTRIAYVIATTVPSLLIVASVPVISMMIGRDFVPALALLPFLFVAPLLDALYYPNANLVYYTSRTRIVPVATVAAAITNVALNLVLASGIGIPGAIAARVAAAAIRLLIIWLGTSAAVRDAHAKDAKG